MGFKGSLQSINLADILQNLSMNRQSGTLKVTDGERTKCVYFHRGEVKYLSHGRRKNVLFGEMLLGRGVATREQVDVALAEQRSHGKLLGDVFVEMGVCTREEVDDLIRFQIEEEIYDLFTWDRGEFEFDEGPAHEDMFDPQQQATELSFNTSHLIMEAARRIDEWERIRQIIPSSAEVFVTFVEVASLPEDTPQVARRLLSFADGTRDVEALIKDSYFSRYEVVSTLVEMLQTGKVRPATAEELRLGASGCLDGGDPERAIRLLERVLAAGEDDPGLRRQLSEACIQAGRKEKAVIHLGVLGDTLFSLGRAEEAASAYERIFDVLPRHVAAHEKLARLRASMGENEEALSHYMKLVQNLVDGGRLDEAIERCREGLVLDQQSTELRSALAKIKLSSGDTEEAIEEFKYLAELFNQKGETRPAVEVYRRILQIDRRNKFAKGRLRDVLQRAGLEKESHAARYVVIAAVVAVLGAGGYVTFRELAVKHAFEKAESEATRLVAQNEFDKASEVLKPFTESWSLAGYRKLAEDRITAIAKAGRAYVERLDRERERREEDARRGLKEAAALASSYKIDEAKAKLNLVLTVRNIPEELKAEARSRLEAIETEEREVGAFREWLGEATKQAAVSLLKEEYRRAVEMHTKYPRNTRLTGLKIPLRIETAPPGARIFVDGAFHSPSPTTIRYPISRPPWIKIELEGYAPVARLEVPKRSGVTVDLKRAPSWECDIEEAVTALATGPRGGLLVADSEGRLSRIDPLKPEEGRRKRNGLRIFEAAERMVGIRSGLLVSRNTVYFGTDVLYSVDLSGRPRVQWKAMVGGTVNAPASEGIVKWVDFKRFIFGTCLDAGRKGKVWCVDAGTGEIIWANQPSDEGTRVDSTPLLVGPQVHVTSAYGKVYGLKASSGERGAVWSTGVPARLSSLVWDGELAWAGSWDGRLYGFDLSKAGKPVRSVEVGWPVTSGLAIKGGLAYFGDERGHVHALKLKTAERVWVSPPGDGSVVGTPVVTDARVYWANRAGRVYAADRETGRIAWDYDLGREIWCGVHFDGRYLYAGAIDGTVCAFDEKLE